MSEVVVLEYGRQRAELYALAVQAPAVYGLFCYAGSDHQFPRWSKGMGPLHGPAHAHAALSAVQSALVARGYRPSLRPPIWQLVARSAARHNLTQRQAPPLPS